VKGETTQRAGPPLSAVGPLVRQHDPDRYRAALFAPRARREGLFALYAFNYEVARVRESVRQPMLGQIRLQWWREVVATAFAGAPPRQHVVAVPLAAAIGNYPLSRAHFDRLIDARERDLADEPPASLAALEAYAEDTAATLLYLSLEVLGVRDAAAEAVARQIGIGYALLGLLRAVPFHARAGRRYIPDEVAAAAGLDDRAYGGARPVAALCKAAETIAEAAAGHLQAARAHRAGVPRAALPALLPAVIAERALARLRRAAWNPYEPSVAAPDPLLTWRLLRAALRGRW